MTNSSSFGFEWKKPYSFEILENGKKFSRNLVNQADNFLLDKEIKALDSEEAKDDWELRETVFKAMKSTVEFLCKHDPDIWGAVKDAFSAAKGTINLEKESSKSSD